MPYQWNAERERLMLLLAVSSSNLKPSVETWAAVAGLLGEGLTPSAVSQKYYKLRKESVKLCGGNALLTPPTTPAKRKAPSGEEHKDVKLQTPTKRIKKTVPKEEDLDGELYSTFSSSPGQTQSSIYSAYHVPFVSEQFSPFGMQQISTKAEQAEGTGYWIGGGRPEFEGAGI